MDKFPKRKYIRLQDYDYSNPGYYYITICTHNRKELFGEIKNNQIILNKFGIIIDKIWKEIPNHYSDIELDTYIIMPNHIHGIIKINNPVGDGHAHPVNKSNNIPTMIGSFKSAVSKQIRKSENNSFHWQRFFYDHQIHTTNSLNNIRKYILANPMNWDNDENNIKNNKVSGQACLPPTG